MNKDSQIEFINNQIHNLRQDLLNKMVNIPDDWKEAELRQIFVDKVNSDHGHYQNTEFSDKRTGNRRAYEKVVAKKRLLW